jgi:hypothetical protein
MCVCVGGWGGNLIYESKQQHILLHLCADRRSTKPNTYVYENTAKFRVLREKPIKIQVLDVQDGAKILRNVSKCLLFDTTLYSRRLNH